MACDDHRSSCLESNHEPAHGRKHSDAATSSQLSEGERCVSRYMKTSCLGVCLPVRYYRERSDAIPITGSDVLNLSQIGNRPSLNTKHLISNIGTSLTSDASYYKFRVTLVLWCFCELVFLLLFRPSPYFESVYRVFILHVLRYISCFFSLYLFIIHVLSYNIASPQFRSTYISVSTSIFYTYSSTYSWVFLYLPSSKLL